MEQFTVYRNKNPRTIELGTPVGNLASARQSIIAAVEFLLTGF